MAPEILTKYYRKSARHNVSTDGATITGQDFLFSDSVWRNVTDEGVEGMLTLQLLFPLAMLMFFWLAGQLERLPNGPGDKGPRRFMGLWHWE